MIESRIYTTPTNRVKISKKNIIRVVIGGAEVYGTINNQQVCIAKFNSLEIKTDPKKITNINLDLKGTCLITSADNNYNSSYVIVDYLIEEKQEYLSKIKTSLAMKLKGLK